MNTIFFVKRVVYILWLSSIAFVLGFFIFNPAAFSPEALQAFFSKFENQIWTAYIFISCVRGFFLIPSMPFVLAGAALFPNDMWWVVGVSLFGLFCSATFLYFWADLIGIGDYLEQKYPKKLERVQYHLNKPYSILLVTFWAFFPFVPTDLICYVARIVRMRYEWMMLGILAGEFPLMLLCVYFGKEIL